MNEIAPRVSSLATCYENSFTSILRLGSKQQAVVDSNAFRNNMRAALKAAMEQAKGLGYNGETIQFSVFAVVAFLDESVLKLQSPVFADWSERYLQQDLFNTNDAGVIFFENLRKLLAREDSQETADCLEVYCLCLLLGFRGRQALGGSGIGTFVRPIREKIGRIRGQVLFLRAVSPPPEVRATAGSDRLSMGLGIVAVCMFLLMLLAYGGFWMALNSGLSRIG